MAFTSTSTAREVVGRKRMAYGTFTNTAGSTGGEINTGLRYVYMCQVANDSATSASSPRVQLNSATAGKVTITTDADVDGNWMALGL